MVPDDVWKSLFDPESVAVIGASNNPGSWGGRIMSNLIAPKNRPIYPVNPSYSEIMGHQSFSGILDIPEPVDMAAIVVRAEMVPNTLRECVRKKVNSVLIISGGFRETGEEGAAREKEILEIAREGNIRFIGPNTMGHMDTHTKLNTVNFVQGMPPGNVALIAQSGNMGARIIQNAERYGMSFSRFVCCGNEASIYLEDYLEYFAGEPNTKVIALYIEGLRDARRFLKTASEITRKKPIVVLKSGGTKSATRASRSHVGALTGADEVYSAAFKQAGVIRVKDDDELCDVVAALLNQPLPKGRKVGILTMGGGLGVVATESCENEGLEITDLEESTIEKLNALLPERWSHANPVDLVGSNVAHSPEIIKTLWILLEDKNLDALLSNAWLGRIHRTPRRGIERVSTDIDDSPDQSEAQHAREFFQQVRKYDVPLYMVGGYPNSANDIAAYITYHKEGFLIYPQPHRAARVIRHLVWYREYLESLNGN
ncbi:MAG: CoA-binding protein [Dehalococcoidales bacterium]|nr:MAG: CoA-binding protein [Dehalococcoidales bacterium]